MRIARIQSSEGAVLVNANRDGSFTRLEGELFGKLHDSGIESKGHFLAPLDPPTIYCIGLNYREHARETGIHVNEYPVVFLKSPTSVTGPESPIQLPPSQISETIDYEAELAIVISQDCKNVRREDALDVILGFTCANDVTARNWQSERGGGQFSRSKTFDTFCPLGPVIVTTDEISDPWSLSISSRLNGTVMQESSTSDLIFDVPTLVEFLSMETTLKAGTVILTGTPQGVGFARKPPVFMRDGDVIEVEIEGIGTLSNPLAASKSDV
ncbi:MAG: fumarylacetoacetate hydrolase family protein [Verrucomicrobiota bacterium]